MNNDDDQFEEYVGVGEVGGGGDEVMGQGGQGTIVEGNVQHNGQYHQADQGQYNQAKQLNHQPPSTNHHPITPLNLPQPINLQPTQQHYQQQIPQKEIYQQMQITEDGLGGGNDGDRLGECSEKQEVERLGQGGVAENRGECERQEVSGIRQQLGRGMKQGDGQEEEQIQDYQQQLTHQHYEQQSIPHQQPQTHYYSQPQTFPQPTIIPEPQPLTNKPTIDYPEPQSQQLPSNPTTTPQLQPQQPQPPTLQTSILTFLNTLPSYTTICQKAFIATNDDFL